MGKTYHFECPLCQYRAKLSGGADSGVHCEVQTIICRECKELFDVFTRVRRVVGGQEFPKNFSAWLRPEIPPVILSDSLFAEKRRPSRGLVWEKRELECPVDAKHRVMAWRNPGRCPRCGSFMEQLGLPFRIWD